MNFSKIESLKSKLRQRYSRLINAPTQLFHYQLRQFHKLLSEEIVYSSIITEVVSKYPNAETKAETIKRQYNAEAIYLGNEEENIAIGFHIVTKVLEGKTLNDDWGAEEYLVMIPKRYGAEGNGRDYFHHFFLSLLVAPIVDFIEERITNQLLILNCLRRFKHFSENYLQEELLSKHQADTSKGEENLKRELYKFLFIEGIEFIIEPQSASGRTDFIVPQTEYKIIADAKIYISETSTITSGFNQIHTYCNNHNEPFGYLIIFKVDETDLKFELKLTNDKIPYLTYNNKTYYFMVIDLFKGKSASKKGGLKVKAISEAELIKVIE